MVGNTSYNSSLLYDFTTSLTPIGPKSYRGQLEVQAGSYDANFFVIF
jgi:hypothetical protein